jgi:hypothetical protein
MEHGLNLFDRFGGIRPMAQALGESPSTVQTWKKTGRVPSIKQPDLLEKANELGLAVTAEDVVFPLRSRSISDPVDPPSPLSRTDGSITGGAPVVLSDRRAEIDRSAPAPRGDA